MWYTLQENEHPFQFSKTLHLYFVNKKNKYFFVKDLSLARVKVEETKQELVSNVFSKTLC